MNKYFLPVYHSDLKPWIKWWILKRLGGGESTLKAVTLSEGTLTKVDKSKALRIKEYYGNAIQDGTPTPDSPVEIQTISGDNTFTINGGDYRLDLGGTQLFNINATPSKVGGSTTYSLNNGILNVSGNWFIAYQVNVKENTDYYISADREIISGTASGNISIYNSAVTTVITNGGRNNFTFNSGNNTVISVVLYAGNGSAGEVNFSNIMLNIGTTEKRYSPYVANPIELCKIGDYKDKIYNVGGTWKVEKNITKVVLDENSTNWTPSIVATGVSRFAKVFSDISIYSDSSRHTGKFIVNRFIPNTNNAVGNAYQYQNQLLFCISSDEATTGDEFKTWLSTHNTSVYYALATPSTETITNTNLISQLNGLYEFYVGMSTVSISNDSEIPFEVLLEYYGR